MLKILISEDEIKTVNLIKNILENYCSDVVVAGYILLNYYWVKFKWTDDNDSHELESGKTYCTSSYKSVSLFADQPFLPIN